MGLGWILGLDSGFKLGLMWVYRWGWAVGVAVRFGVEIGGKVRFRVKVGVLGCNWVGLRMGIVCGLVRRWRSCQCWVGGWAEIRLDSCQIRVWVIVGTELV